MKIFSTLFGRWQRRCGLSLSALQQLVRKLSHDSEGKGSPYSITERRVPELIPVLGNQPAGDVSHKPGGRPPLLSVRPAVTPATNLAAW